MQSNNLRIEHHLAGLIFLAGIAYMAAPRPKPKVAAVPVTPKTIQPAANTSLNQMFPPERLQAIKRKALKRYKAKQDVQWQRWLDSVSR